MSSFDQFGFAEPISRALADENYVTPTPIQAQTLPVAMTGRDVVGIAQTGTGKTAAFALPILHQIHANRIHCDRKTCRVLVLSPTRELSGQILDSFRAYGRHMRVSAALAIGGVSMGGQVRSLLNGVEVLVATPGRLLDLIQSNALKLDRVEFLVLDEADRMLDMGFINDIRKIVSRLPKQRQTLFFSATMPKAIADLAAQMLTNPAHVAVTPAATTVERIDQRIIHLDRAAKPSTLIEVLKTEPIDRTLVFTRTKHGADRVVRHLAQAGIESQAIHGNKSQSQRDRVLTAFRKGELRILVATDIAARGIDVDGISHVVNYDLPNIPDSYVHRIGRTARAGADGIAISFCDAEEVAFLRDIERLIKISIPSTDRRSAPGAHRPAAPARNGKPQHARSNNGRSHQGKPQQAKSGRGSQGQGQGPGRGHGKPEHGKPDHARPDHVKRPHRGGHGRPGEPRGDNRAAEARGSEPRGERGHELAGIPFMKHGRADDRRSSR